MARCGAAYHEGLVAIGPRPAGSEANSIDTCERLVAAHFKKLGGKTTEQAFSGEDPKTGAKVNMANLVGAWHPERKERIVIGAHYDTRPFLGRGGRLRSWQGSPPFVGANDGASGVALLMELAHHLEKLPTEWGVDPSPLRWRGAVSTAAVRTRLETTSSAPTP